MTSLRHYDLIIVGAGISGSSVAWHLKDSNLKILLIDKQLNSTTRQCPGIIAGGMHDRFTRFSNSHGHKIAKQIWEFGDLAFAELISFAKDKNIAHKIGQRLRLIVNDHELKEAKIAVEEMSSCGLEANLINNSKSKLANYLLNRCLMVQDEGKKGGLIDIKNLLKKLRELSKVEFKELEISSVSYQGDGSLKCKTTDSQEFISEALVLCCHSKISSFIPELKDVLVTYVDQWSNFHNFFDHNQESGLVWSAYHGYEWGAFNGSSLLTGGNRFLRPYAGIGSKEAVIDKKIEDFSIKKLKETFISNKLESISTTSLIEIFPCDELPVVGPMFGQNRILLATGYMNQGITLGFLAGKEIANLIMNGSTSSLPQIFKPERFRSI